MSETLRDHIVNSVCGLEGGYVDNPHDLGGKTRYGVTEETASEYRYLWKLFNWEGDMETLPVALARAIYIEGWWKRLRCDQVLEFSPNLAERLMDFGINAGRKNAAQSLQRILNVMNNMGRLYPNLTVDGYIGPTTLKRLGQYFESNYASADEKITMLMYSMQNYHYINISEKREGEENERFTRGWVNRVYYQWLNYVLRLSARTPKL